MAFDRFRTGGYIDIIVCVLIIAFSVAIYALRSHISDTTWCLEVFGFVWVIVFFHVKNRFAEWMGKKWCFKCIALWVIAGMVGVVCLKLKPMIFFGDYILKILLGVLIIAFMLVVNSHVAIGNKVSLFLGRITYEVYLLHGIVFGAIVFFTPKISSGVFIGLSIVITVGVAGAVRVLAIRIVKVVKA